jgi:two-component system, NarL family, sensor histidine kinase UhpB
MTLRLKINLIVGLLSLLMVVGVLTLQFRTTRDAVKEEVVAANKVAGQLLNRTALLYASQGAPAMLDFLQGVGRVRANEITLFDAAGKELYRSPASPYKAGREAPVWFDQIVSPARSEQSIAFPDGRIVVRSNASRAVLDAWDAMLPLAAGAALLLVAVHLLVYWAVGRAIKPFGRIVQALGEVQAGRFDVLLPALPGREAAAIGASFNRMVGVLRENIATERRAAQAERQLSDSRELARWMDGHIEQERRMIARELHDELGQSVTAIRSMALSVAQRVQASDPTSEQAARLIADESSRLYDAMHGLIPRLTPLVLDNFGLGDALADLIERMQASHPGLAIDSRIVLPPSPMPAELTLALYRAAQEGLTNAIRHGQATRVQLVLQGSDDELQLTLADNGRGLPEGGVAREGHYGLRWLTERVEGLGGQVALAAGDHGSGARLLVTVPMHTTAPATPAAQGAAA